MLLVLVLVESGYYSGFVVVNHSVVNQHPYWNGQSCLALLGQVKIRISDLHIITINLFNIMN